jgi:uncharacterized protein (TIGR00369 family)
LRAVPLGRGTQARARIQVVTHGAERPDAPLPSSDLSADAGIDLRVRTSFEKQRAMATMGAVIARVAPGEVDIALPYSEDLTQQHGFMHAGVLAAVADSACGYAALTLMAPGTAVLSVEFKINLLAPAAGTRFVARGRVLRAGRTITVCRGDVVSMGADEEKLVATMQSTMMTVRNRDGLVD